MRRLALAIAGLMMAAAPLWPGFAHHGWSGYDMNQTLTVSGPLMDVSWGNPHGTAKIRYGGSTWDVILAPTARMEARGLSLDMIDKGQAVTLVGYPKSDGTKEMRIERLSVGGKTIELR